MTATIADRELRDLFRAEAGDRSAAIEKGLLALEKAPGDAVLLEGLFREAHSLKGAARMLGLREIQGLAHEIESRLAEARKAPLPDMPGEVAAQLARLDRIRRLVAEATGASTGAAPAAVPAPALGAVAAPEKAPRPDDLRADSLRVDAAQLDGLIQLAAELLVTKSRIAGWEAEAGVLLRSVAHLKHRAAGVSAAADAVVAGAEQLRSRMASDLARFDTLASGIDSGLRRLRMLPASTLLEPFPRMVRDLALEIGKEISWEAHGDCVVADRRVLEEMRAPLMHLLRNAVDHGIEPPEERERAGKPREGRIRVVVTREGDVLQLEVSDDGRGLDLDAIRQQAAKRHLHRADELARLSTEALHALVLLPGFSTAGKVTDVSGRGVGLDVVRSSIEGLRGTLRLESIPGRGTTVRVRVPVSLTALTVLLVRERDETYALPFAEVEFLRHLPAGTPEDAPYIDHAGKAVPLARLGDLLGRPAPARAASGRTPCVVVRVAGDLLALAVDEVLEIEDVIVKPTVRPLVRVRNVAGLAVLGSGRACAVLNVYDLRRGLGARTRRAAQAAATEAPRQKRILLAEDSITTRTLESVVLESAGYSVATAVDGLDAWQLLSRERFDAVVSDVQMPRMSGLDLVKRIRESHQHARLPVVLVTSLDSDEDRRRGLEAGADAYIAKPEFDHSLLLDCLSRLV